MSDIGLYSNSHNVLDEYKEELIEKYESEFTKRTISNAVSRVQAYIVNCIYLSLYDDTGKARRTPFNQLKIIRDIQSLLFENVGENKSYYIELTRYADWFSRLRKCLIISTEADNLRFNLLMLFGDSIIDKSAQFGEHQELFLSFVNEITRGLIERLTVDAVERVKNAFPEDFDKYQRVEGVMFVSPLDQPENESDQNATNATVTTMSL